MTEQGESVGGPGPYHRPELLLACGVGGFLAMVAPLGAMCVAALVAQHDIVADTVSDLARGPHKWIMDTGFYVNAGGLLALAIAAAHLHLGRTGWSAGIFALAGLALVIVLLGIWDEFHEGWDKDLTVHTKLSFALGPLYLAGPLFMARGIGRVSGRLSWVFVVSAALWLALSATYVMAPTGYDGLLEKAAIAATLLWTMPLAWVFARKGMVKARSAS